MPTIAPLSPTYAAARADFLAAASAASATVTTYPHPLTGLEGEQLAVDVAELGPADAADVVTVFSATHGVEGYCGSALQTHWLRHCTATRPAHVRVSWSTPSTPSACRGCGGSTRKIGRAHV